MSLMGMALDFTVSGVFDVSEPNWQGSYVREWTTQRWLWRPAHMGVDDGKA